VPPEQITRKAALGGDEPSRPSREWVLTAVQQVIEEIVGHVERIAEARHDSKLSAWCADLRREFPDILAPDEPESRNDDERRVLEAAGLGQPVFDALPQQQRQAGYDDDGQSLGDSIKARFHKKEVH
jgi:hypothetical protein